MQLIYKNFFFSIYVLIGSRKKIKNKILVDIDWISFFVTPKYVLKLKTHNHTTTIMLLTEYSYIYIIIIKQIVYLERKTCSDAPNHRDVLLWVIGL